MPQHPRPALLFEPKQQPIQDSRATPTGKGRASTILAACARMALPVACLVGLYGFPQQVSASTVSALPAPAQDIASLEKAAGANPSVDNRINLSLAYIRANQPVRAIPILREIVAKDGKNALAWNNLCVADTMQMAYRNAIDECQNALRIAPDFQLARNNLIWAKDEQQKAVVAITQQEQAAPVTRNAESYLNEGLDDLHLGNYDQAIKAWQRTLELDPKSALAANNIGTAYMLKKDTATAIPWLEKARILDPTLQIAQNNLAWAHDEQAKLRK